MKVLFIVMCLFLCGCGNEVAEYAKKNNAICEVVDFESTPYNAYGRALTGGETTITYMCSDGEVLYRRFK